MRRAGYSFSKIYELFDIHLGRGLSGPVCHMILQYREVHMIIEGQGLKVRKGQYVCPNIFSGLNNTLCRLIFVKLINTALIES